MARKQRKQTARKTKSGIRRVEVGQRVVVAGYGPGTVIAVECRRGFHYSDAWVRPDDGSACEIGVRYGQGLLSDAEQINEGARQRDG
ncbi:MAG: hypothetical protein ACOC9Y_01400 [Chloroflexota bacterium]